MANNTTNGRAAALMIRVGVSLLALTIAGTATAQTTPPPIDTLPPAEQVKAEAAAEASEGAGAGEVIVTGSRIVANGAAAPTPLTVVSADTLLQTTPTNLPDGLNKLPVFQGSVQPRRSGDGSGNSAQNVLSLRGFGAQRTLVLFDGHRVAPSNANGTVDIDTLPQNLVQRIDVVTGGASAVYGSDAVTGVVNFVLDRKFTGVKLEGNAGISDYGDAFSWKASAAWGGDIDGGRGHLLASFQHYQIDGVDNFDRPYGPTTYVLTGNGTAAAPFVTSANVRRADSTFGGLVTSCTASCPNALNRQFVSDGVLGIYNAGTRTTTTNQNIGGDGAYSPYTTALVAQRNDEAFGRLDYKLTDDINFFAQASYAIGYTYGYHFPVKLTPGNGQASTFFKNNAFLSAATRTLLGDNGLSNTTNTFQLGSYIINGGQEWMTGTRNLNKYASISTGVNGTIGDLRWDVFFTRGVNRLKVESLNNSNYQNQFAALDAVNVNGTNQCYAATQAATASRYANCVPLNAFGPTAITQQAFDYFTDSTFLRTYNQMDDLSASLTGQAFEWWAGPVNFAISGEARWNKYKVRSSASPLSTVDCTGLRICSSSLQLWAQPVSAEIDASNNVWEVAGELSVPLLRDVPLVQALSTSLAGRHTDYSTSGSVKTWKVGLDWEVNDTIRFRGTMSRDIRAPTLNDLFQPIQRAVIGFVDLHTSISAQVFNQTQGNPNLVPEIARTYTAGVVLTPSFWPGFNISVDYYKITMRNAIGTIAASSNTIQRLCEDSNGTSQFCSLYQRPLPFDNRTAANYPTRVFTQGLNAAFRQVKGYDLEVNYSAPIAGGRFSIRGLANYQPTNKSQSFPGAPFVREIGPETRVTSFARFDTGKFGIGVQDRWLSGFSQIASAGQIYADPDVRSFNTVDLNLDYKLDVGGAPVTIYGTVQNAFNAKPEIVAGGGSIGLFYPVPAGQDILGRYFTLGLKTRF